MRIPSNLFKCKWLEGRRWLAPIIYIILQAVFMVLLNYTSKFFSREDGIVLVLFWIFWPFSVILYYIIVFRNPGYVRYVDKCSPHPFKQTSYQLDGSILNSKDIQGNQAPQINLQQTLSGVGNLKLNKKELVSIIKSQSIKQNQANIQQLQLQQQHQLSQQLSTMNQNVNQANFSKSQLHDEFQSEMISQPHLNANAATQEQANNTNPNVKEVNHNINSTSFQYNPLQHTYQNNAQGLPPSLYQIASQLHNQGINISIKNSQGQNIKNSQFNNYNSAISQIDGNQFSIQGFKQNVNLEEEQQINSSVFRPCQQQNEMANQNQDKSCNAYDINQKEILQNIALNNQISTSQQPQTSHFYIGPNINQYYQTSHTDLTSMNGNTQKNIFKYQVSDENEGGSSNFLPTNGLQQLASKMHNNQAKMSEIPKEDSYRYIQNSIKATLSEFGKPTKQSQKITQTENNGETEVCPDTNVFIGGESEGGITVMQAMQMYQMGLDPNQYFNYELGQELDMDEESDRVQSFRENSESVQSQQICLDDLKDEEEEEEEKQDESCQNKKQLNDEDAYNGDSQDIDEHAKNNLNEYQSSNAINKEQLKALKKKIVSTALSIVEKQEQKYQDQMQQQKQVQFDSGNDQSNGEHLEEFASPKKIKQKISFSPNIEQNLFVDGSAQINSEQHECEQKATGLSPSKSTPTLNQKQQKGIMKQHQLYKVNENQDNMHKMLQLSLHNSLGSQNNYFQYDINNFSHLNDAVITKYNISFGRNFKEELQNHENDDNLNKRDVDGQIQGIKVNSLQSCNIISSGRDHNSSYLASIQSESHQSPTQQSSNKNKQLNIQYVLEFQHQGGVYFKERERVSPQRISQSPNYHEGIAFFQQNYSNEGIKEQDLLSPIQFIDQQQQQKQQQYNFQSLIQKKLSFNTPDPHNLAQQQDDYLDDEASYRDQKLRYQQDLQGKALFKNENPNSINNSNYDPNFEHEFIYSALSSNKLLNSYNHSRKNSNYFNSQQKGKGTLNNSQRDPSFSEFVGNLGIVKKGIIQNTSNITFKNNQNNETTMDEDKNITQLLNSPVLKKKSKSYQNQESNLVQNRQQHASGVSTSKNSYFIENTFEPQHRSSSTASYKKGKAIQYFQSNQKLKQNNLILNNCFGVEQNQNQNFENQFEQQQPIEECNQQHQADTQDKEIQEENDQIIEQQENLVNVNKCKDSLNNLNYHSNELGQEQNDERHKIPDSLSFTNQLLQPLSTNTNVNLTLTDNKIANNLQNTNTTKSCFTESSPNQISPQQRASLIGFQNKDLQFLTKKCSNTVAKYSQSSINSNQNNYIASNPQKQSPSQINYSFKDRSGSVKLANNTNQSAQQCNNFNDDASQENVKFNSSPYKQKSFIDQGSHHGIFSREELQIFSNEQIEGSVQTKLQLKTQTQSNIIDKQNNLETEAGSASNIYHLQKKESRNNPTYQQPILKQNHSNLISKSVAFAPQGSNSQIQNFQAAQLQSGQFISHIIGSTKEGSSLQQQKLTQYSSQLSNQNYVNAQIALYSPSAKSNLTIQNAAGMSFFKNNQTNLSNESFNQTNTQCPNPLTPSSNSNNNPNNLNTQKDLQNINAQIINHESFTPNHISTIKRNSSNANYFHKLSTGMRNTMNTVPNIVYTTQGNTSQTQNNPNLKNTISINNNNNNNTNNNNNNNENITITNYTAPYFFEKRYCKYCYINQPTRSKHCLICNRCISTYDHHCPWIGVCIAQRNHLFFFFFIICQNVVSTLTIIEFIHFLAEKVNWKIQSDVILAVFSIISTFFLVYIFGMTILLVAQHTYYILFNLTTWEFYSWEKITYLKDLPRKFGSPFSLGILKNIKHRIISTFSSDTYEWQINKLRLPPQNNIITNQP
ncbi:DHHC zinc finger protein (macronuclear) [Tetrahymena thermophila SB210]|uniref:protein S-acyltransferase n=1 Tax=Tetrahymena thermophila (strain SB210) TaxID=312017 RepID=Q22KK6_TETTS|nr:DHHC zinc finger protein [Tetrahymena thermophila SB210]EAR85793.2 DHHC zinc finger protein [Tetrahymena thermophila SB210]|eukprot:XP_001033456.2 DHHC zinc finger protein [Tetrahymena thermophila SB210]